MQIHVRIKRFAVIGSGVGFFLLGLVIYHYREWVLPYGLVGLFLYALVGPATILVPVYAQHFTVLSVAIVASLGLTINDCIGWLIGKNGDVVVKKPDKLILFEGTIRRYGLIPIFLFSLMPFPYDFVSVAAGYVGIPFWQYAITIFFGRFFRFILMGTGTLVIFGHN